MTPTGMCFRQDEVRGMSCIECGEPFSSKNVFTPEGWAETRISGMCESCFDNLFKED